MNFQQQALTAKEQPLGKAWYASTLFVLAVICDMARRSVSETSMRPGYEP